MAGDSDLTGAPGAGPADGPGHRPAADVIELRLTGEQIGLLRREGEVRPVAAGEVLFREGDRGYDFLVILAGRVAIVDHQAGTERELATGGPGEFVAELNLLTGERLFTTAVVTEPGEVLAVPVARLSAVVSQDQGLGQWIIRTMFARRQWLMQMRTGLRIVGSRSSPQTRRLLEFATRLALAGAGRGRGRHHQDARDSARRGPRRPGRRRAAHRVARRIGPARRRRLPGHGASAWP